MMELESFLITSQIHLFPTQMVQESITEDLMNSVISFHTLVSPQRLWKSKVVLMDLTVVMELD